MLISSRYHVNLDFVSLHDKSEITVLGIKSDGMSIRIGNDPFTTLPFPVFTRIRELLNLDCYWGNQSNYCKIDCAYLNSDAIINLTFNETMIPLSLSGLINQKNESTCYLDVYPAALYEIPVLGGQ